MAISLRSRRLLCAAFAVALAGLSFGASAQKFPDKPVRIVIPQPPGSSSDTMLRLVAQNLSKRWGQSVVVDNRPGGGTLIASSIVARAAPDGYTLLFTYTDHVFYPSYHAKMPYDVIADFTPITTIATLPVVFLVPASLPAKDLKEFLALVKEKPGQLNFGSAAPGGSIHLITEQFKSAAKIDIVHVPYAGTGPVLTDLIGGRIQLLAVTTLLAPQYIAKGDVRALGVSSPERVPQVPDIPTIAEAGLPGYSASIWYGFMGPAHMPKALVDQLSADIAATVKSAGVADRFAATGANTETRTPAEFSQLVKSDLAKWSGIIKAANIRIN